MNSAKTVFDQRECAMNFRLRLLSLAVLHVNRSKVAENNRRICCVAAVFFCNAQGLVQCGLRKFVSTRLLVDRSQIAQETRVQRLVKVGKPRHSMQRRSE